MQKAKFSEEIRDLALDMAWSLWAELSLSGWSRRHSSSAIDLEALILFTSWLGQYDRRLRDESVDWCISNARFVSGVRLRNLLRRSADVIAGAFDDYSSTVKGHVRVPWPGAGTAWPMTPSGKSDIVELDRPALLQLKLRAIFGVSARSEILKSLVAGPERAWSAADLAAESTYGKDNVAAALNLLALAGLVAETRVGNGLRYELRQYGALKALLGELPGRFPRWSHIFSIVQLIVEFAVADRSDRSDLVRAVEAGRVLREATPSLAILGIDSSAPHATGTPLNYQFDAWAQSVMRGWANSADSMAEEVGEGEEATYTINRLTVPPGAWLGVIVHPGEHARPLEMPEWKDLYEEHTRSDTVISDDSIGAPRVAHEIMRLAEQRAGRDIGDYWGGGQGINQLVARAFAEERLWPMRQGTSVTWGERFLRAWRRDRLDRMRSATEGQAIRSRRLHSRHSQ